MPAFSTWTAAELYGGAPSPQPNATGVPDHPAGTPEPIARTLPRPSAKGLLGDPIFVLVALLAVAWLVLNLSIGFSARVEVDA